VGLAKFVALEPTVIRSYSLSAQSRQNSSVKPGFGSLCGAPAAQQNLGFAKRTLTVATTASCWLTVYRCHALMYPNQLPNARPNALTRRLGQPFGINRKPNWLKSADYSSPQLALDFQFDPPVNKPSPHLPLQRSLALLPLTYPLNRTGNQDGTYALKPLENETTTYFVRARLIASCSRVWAPSSSRARHS
jgi:hypothetical protein